MCFKSFLRTCDKACHRQHRLPVLVWPSAPAFRPSHVNGLTHDPNWSPALRRAEPGVSRLPGREVFKFCLWNLSWPPSGHFSLGGEPKNWQTQTTRGSVSGPAFRRSHIKRDAPSLSPQLDRTPIPGRSWEKLIPLHQTLLPNSSLSTNGATGDQFVFPHNGGTHRPKLCKY